MAMNAAQRRYLGRMVLVSIAYVASVFFASRIIPEGASATPFTVGVALIPGAAILGFIWALGSYLTGLADEYLRLLEVRKALVATGLTLAVTATWGLLEIYTDVPRLGIFWVFPIWCIGLAVGALFNRVTMGSDGGCP